jgi:RHH-type transcriptional regulator, proline utilization regulon repressor / proline dehydrogenase / delta 1-pyrroline-5-carboxylate dehydrogenase
VPGDGRVGARWSPPAVAGVAFTGSTEVARAINRALAAKDGPIVPLIAETGGINAMIVDATALARAGRRRRRDLRLPLRRPALLGAAAAVRAGGRRRPHDRDDRGAAAELALGDPRDPATDPSAR